MTEEGLFTMREVVLKQFMPGPATLLLSGDFEGLAVMEPYCEDPVILTTRKCQGIVAVCMIGRFLSLTSK